MSINKQDGCHGDQSIRTDDTKKLTGCPLPEAAFHLTCWLCGVRSEADRVRRASG